MIYVESDLETISKTLKFVTTSNDGFIKMNEIDFEKGTTSCKKSFHVCNSGISAGCQLSGQESFALAGKNNDIYIFSFQTGTCINEIQAHDDYINTILFHDAKLITCSMDQSLKIWDLKKPQYENEPLTIYDHDDEVVCADVRHCDSLLASMDIQGTIYIRSIKDLKDAETILYTISSIPKDAEDYARLVFNGQMPDSDGEILILINGVALLMNVNGK